MAEENITMDDEAIALEDVNDSEADYKVSGLIDFVYSRYKS